MTIISKSEAEDKALDVKQKIVSVLLRAMQRRGITYKDVSKSLGISQHSMRLLLSASYPNVDFIDLFRCCAYLNVGLTVRSGSNILFQQRNKRSESRMSRPGMNVHTHTIDAEATEQKVLNSLKDKARVVKRMKGLGPKGKHVEVRVPAHKGRH